MVEDQIVPFRPSSFDQSWSLETPDAGSADICPYEWSQTLSSKVFWVDARWANEVWPGPHRDLVVHYY